MVMRQAVPFVLQLDASAKAAQFGYAERLFRPGLTRTIANGVHCAAAQ
jgi:hypothetical protein